jgi:ectoine hydroxylase-related dioxygenase (phytanoyl-CoA dioxygenase family)
LFDQFHDDGTWSGFIGAADLATVALDQAVEACGSAGTVVLIHCRVVHGSATNRSPRDRPLLLNVYSSADSMAFTPAPTPTRFTGQLVRGSEPRHLHMEPYPARLPPRWDQVGYGSIFTAQGDDR